MRLTSRLLFEVSRKIKRMLLLKKLGFYRNLRTKKPRRINLESKKIVYIGHSYHNKTKSTEFLIDFLRQYYDVSLILDESWHGRPFPDLSFIDESYLGVIFFQGLPSQEILKRINNNNLIFFPMYDDIRRDYELLDPDQDLKVMNFSKTLHTKLIKLGFESIYVQYFPKPHEFIPGNTDEVFFWQRLEKININVVSKLFKNENLRIHIHKVLDPNQAFVQPSIDDEKKFQISYSDWFETRDEMWEMIKKKGIYIAPRESEGIGLSFLEAMAMGKAVISVKNPTMSEYIEHNETGYLFDLSHPKNINLSNIKQIQKNTHKFMQKGYEEWGKNKYKIIEFIEKT